MPDDLSSNIVPTPRRVPEQYLRAEISAFPIASDESFRSAMLELDPRLPEPLPEPPDKKNPTRELWRACESLYAPHTGWSLDRLVAARDLGWFGGSPSLKPIFMQAYLRNLARSHLMARPGVTEIEERTELSAIDAHDHYRWLTFALPEDLLMAALGVEPVPRRVDKDLPPACPQAARPRRGRDPPAWISPCCRPRPWRPWRTPRSRRMPLPVPVHLCPMAGS